MLTPASINQKEFGTTRLREGYDQKEVDDFLDEVAEQLQVTTQRLAAAEAELAVLKRLRDGQPTAVIPPVPAEPPQSAAGILALAQETADRHVAEAQDKGAGLLADARAEAERLKAEAAATVQEIKSTAVAEAQRLKTEGLAEKQRALDDMEARHGQVLAAVDRLREEGTKIREALNAALARYESQVPPT